MMMLKMDRILLVHPLGYGSENAGRDISRMANIMPPLGLASIAAFLEKDNVRADIVDCYASPLSDPFIRDYLTGQRPAFIGFSCTTSSFLDGVRIADLAKSIEPRIKTVFGGPHVSALKTRILERLPRGRFLRCRRRRRDPRRASSKRRTDGRPAWHRGHCVS